MKRSLLFLIVAFLSVSASAFANTYTYVGSWEVSDGPSWFNVPPAYSGQEAAALLFGGSASDYIISTVSTGAPNGEAWYSTWGGACGGNFPCGTQAPDNSVVTETGYYSLPGDTSAYVADWAVGSQFTNYAYLAATPEPGFYGFLALSLGALAVVVRQRRRA